MGLPSCWGWGRRLTGKRRQGARFLGNPLVKGLDCYLAASCCEEVGSWWLNPVPQSRRSACNEMDSDTQNAKTSLTPPVN